MAVFTNKDLTSRFAFTVHIALALAMSRDGSSGGVIRMAIITEKGVERIFVPGDKLPGMLLDSTRAFGYQRLTFVSLSVSILIVFHIRVCPMFLVHWEG